MIDATTEHIRAGRALKYRAARTPDSQRRAALFADAAAQYLAAARIGAPSTYALINAASLTAMARDRPRATELAGDVLRSLASGDHAPDTPYWLAATRAEAELIRGDFQAADAVMARAVALAPRAWEEHAIALRQFRLLLGELGEPAGWLDRFTPPPILAYGGLMALAVDDGEARARIDESIEAIAPCEAYGALAAGTDIIAAEALLDRGAELHVVLPVDRDRFRSASVTAVAGAWGPRFDACADRAASVHVLAPGGAIDAAASGIAAQVAMGSALGRAKELMTVATGLRAVGPHGGNPEIGKAWEAWAASGNPVTRVELERSIDFAGFGPGRPTAVRAILADGAPDHSTRCFDTVIEALAAARGEPDAQLGLDIEVGDPVRGDMAVAAATAGGGPGLWASADALALARLAEPGLDAELAGAVRHARGTGDLFRVYLP